jgi:hypothetical protein
MNRWMAVLGLCLGLVLGARAAQADQCGVDLERSAIWFRLLMGAESGDFIWFCQPCGDAAPRPLSVLALEEGHDGEVPALFVPMADGRRVTIDLAYVYLPTARETRQPDGAESYLEEVYYNLGVMTGCGATGVSAELRYTAGHLQVSPVAQ